ncbi:MAG: AMP-binding protein [Geobacter sp.]|nr:AMP-binding protein [Geobacter sp.]
MLIHNFLENSATRFPEKVALILSGKKITYSQLNRSADIFANWFIKSGMQLGDRVLFLLENGEEYVISYYAALKAGLVVAPISTETRSDALYNILSTINPKVVIVSPKAEKAFHEITDPISSLKTVIFINPKLSWQHRPFSTLLFNSLLDGEVSSPKLAFDNSSLASIIFTSGSTGKPKGVMLTHANIVANTHSIIQYLNLTEGDRQMVVLPLFYVMGKSLLNTHIAVSGSLVINNTFAYPASVLKQMVDENVTGFSGVPSTYAYLLHRSPLKSYKNKLPFLRYCSQAGGHMARKIKEELLEALPDHTKLYVMYGATEASARLSYVEPARLRLKIDSIGVPIPGVTMRIVDPYGNELPVGKTGELIASGANIMKGYWNDPESTLAAISHIGYHTGDLGYKDADGYFYLVGRKDNQLKVGGHRINPQEVEDALIATGLLIEVAVMGITDHLYGQKLVAIAVPINNEITEMDVIAKCIMFLPRYKVPSEITFVNMLPKNSSGKIDRQLLFSQ